VSAAKHPGCRIGTVTLKASGFQIVRLHDGPERTRAAVLRETRNLIDGMAGDGRPVVGFALVAWDSVGGSDAVCMTYPGSNIPSIAIPDLARNRLLAAKLCEWGCP
jgi:hypothetical protein